MRRLVLTLALVCAAASTATLTKAATTREEASQLIKRYYERHPEAARPTGKRPAGPLTTHSPAGSSTKQPPATDVSSLVLGKRYAWFDNGRKMGVIAFGTGGFAYDDWLHVPQAWSVAPNGDLIVSSDSSRWVTRLTLDPATGRFSGLRDRTSKTQDGTRSELVLETPPSTATNPALPPDSPSAPPKMPGTAATLPAPTETQQSPKAPAPPIATAPYGVTPQCKELFNRGLEYTKAGKQQDAIRLYGEVLAQCPRTCPAMNNMGSAYNSIGDRNNAKIWFEAAVRCDPKNQTFKTNATALQVPVQPPTQPVQPQTPQTAVLPPQPGQPQTAEPPNVTGYWALDRAEFVSPGGALEWDGQIGIKIKVLQHDASKYTVREADPRGAWSRTYVIAWQIPDRLIPGEFAPFQLEVTCTQADSAPVGNWSLGGYLVANFNAGEYLDASIPACVVGRTGRAQPVRWKIPGGKEGDTTMVKAGSVPTSGGGGPVDQQFYFKWVTGAPPVGATNKPPQATGQTPTSSPAKPDMDKQCQDIVSQGIAKSKSHDLQGAIQFYQRALQLCPQHCPAMNDIGVTYEALGNKKAAKAWVDAAVRCNPNSDLYKQNTTRIAAALQQIPASPPQVASSSRFDGVYVGMAEYEGRKTAKLTWKVSGSRITLTSEKDTSQREFVGVVRPSGDFVIEFPNNTYSGRISGRSLSGTFRLHKGVLGGKGGSGTFSANR